MPRASRAAGKSCRRRGFDACRLHPLFSAGVVGGGASPHAACIQCCWWDLPAARPRRMPLVFLVFSRTYQGGASTHVVCIPCFWLELPAARLRCMPLASIVSGRSCRRRGFDAWRLHPVLLAGAAGGEASTHGACIRCFWQELPAARLRRMPLASSVAGMRCRRRGLVACRMHPGLLERAAGGEASPHAACIQCC